MKIIDHIGVADADLKAGPKVATFEEMYARLAMYSKEFRRAAEAKGQQSALALLGAWARKSIVDRSMNVGVDQFEPKVDRAVKDQRMARTVPILNFHEAVGLLELAVMRIGMAVIGGQTSDIGQKLIVLIATVVRVAEDLKLENIRIKKAPDANP